MSEKERGVMFNKSFLRETLLVRASEIAEAKGFPFHFVYYYPTYLSENAADVRFFADREGYYKGLLEYALPALIAHAHPGDKHLIDEINKALDD